MILDGARQYALIALGSLLLVGLAGWLVAGQLLRPLRLLREAAERISHTDLSPARARRHLHPRPAVSRPPGHPGGAGRAGGADTPVRSAPVSWHLDDVAGKPAP